ncbi:uncharacterized protein AB9W97_019020 isoform 2-T2 [Spinachia spinachia]
MRTQRSSHPDPDPEVVPRGDLNVTAQLPSSLRFVKMPDAQTQNQPLLAATSQQAVNAQGGRSSRAYKVAGLTLLACVLITGQVVTTYFVLSQRSDLKSLQDESSNLQSRLSASRSAAVPKHMSMNAFSKVLDVVDKEASTEVTDQTVPQHATDCQLEEAGQKPLRVPGFRPACDERGLYRPEQCFAGHCWCVSPADGQVVTGSAKGCGASVRTDRFSKRLTLPDPVGEFRSSM